MKLEFRYNGIMPKKARAILANTIINYIREQEINNLIGINHPIPSQTLKEIFEQAVLQLKLLTKIDKTNPEYLVLINQEYGRIMDYYIRRNEKGNIHYLPELVYILGKGYVIVENQETVQKYKDQRTIVIKGQEENLEARITDATNFLDLQLTFDIKKLHDKKR